MSSTNYQAEVTPLPRPVTWQYKTGNVLQLKGRTMGRLTTFTELKYAWSVESDGNC
jgi:hypothetical protein